MFKTILTGAAAAALAAMPAAAIVKKATYTGLIREGMDFSDFFVIQQYDSDNNLIFNNLAGLRYVATYIYNTDLGADGGTDLGAASPLISATITINGNSKSITGARYTLLNVSPDYVEHYAFERGAGFFPFGYDSFLNNGGYATGAPVSLETNFAPSTFEGFGSFKIFDTRDGVYQDASATFASEVTYSVGGVPEPASWALMIIGFGVVGTASRRRNRELAS